MYSDKEPRVLALTFIHDFRFFRPFSFSRLLRFLRYLPFNNSF